MKTTTKPTLWERICAYIRNSLKRHIMHATYTIDTNQIECIGWDGTVIWVFSGELTPELWKEIQEYCVKESHSIQGTRLYVYPTRYSPAIVYHEPIADYANTDLSKLPLLKPLK